MKKIGYLLVIVLVIACKQKSKEKTQTENFFPVLSFIKSQVAHVDTSFYPIIRITWRDTVHTDTAYIKREDFKNEAKDFLNMPDISIPEYKDLYAEEKFYDEGTGIVSFTYKAKNPDNVTIQLQEIQIQPDPSGDKVKSFYIHLVSSNKDSAVEKKMLWRVDKSFQVVSSTQKPGETEINNRFKVAWNEDENE